MDNQLPNVNVQRDMDDQQNTQESTQQATQEDSQNDEPDWLASTSQLWGCLQPCKSESGLERIDFWRGKPEYSIGRNTTRGVNDIQLSGMRISMRHCKIIWDGTDIDVSKGSSMTGVMLHDSSTNGTYINGVRVKKNGFAVLRDGNELALGSVSVQDDPREDYRFIYRHLARKGADKDSIHAYYEMGNELGKGTFATVMRGMNKESGDWFAVKIVHNAKVRGPNSSANTASFAREVQILQELAHPYICKFIEVFWGNDFDDTYLVLELVGGGDLLEYILNNEGLGEMDAQRITYQICDAMAYIHSKGIAHRDLKPENVLLTPDNPPNVKVADFGLAKLVDAATMLKTMCGTPSYLAPEVVEQTGQGYDNLVDSWSVGVIVFSMLTNATPFIDPEGQTDLRTKIAQRRIDWALLDDAGVSPLANDFISRLLEENPKTRMTLTEALEHPWLLPYRAVHVYPGGVPFSNTRPGTPELRETDPNSSTLSQAPNSFSKVNPSLRHSPSRINNGAHNDDLSLEENGNLGLNGLRLSPQRRNLPPAQPSSSAMPGAYPKVSGSRVPPLERRSSVLARQQWEEDTRANGTNDGTPTTPAAGESWQIVEAPVVSPKAGEKRRARPAEDENALDAIGEESMAEPVPKIRRRNASAGKPRSKAAAPASTSTDSSGLRRSSRNKKV